MCFICLKYTCLLTICEYCTLIQWKSIRSYNPSELESTQHIIWHNSNKYSFILKKKQSMCMWIYVDNSGMYVLNIVSTSWCIIPFYVKQWSAIWQRLWLPHREVTRRCQTWISYKMHLKNFFLNVFNIVLHTKLMVISIITHKLSNHCRYHLIIVTIC